MILVFITLMILVPVLHSAVLDNDNHVTDPLDEYDILIVGSGAGGLALAVLLSELKYRVLLIERDSIGGSLHVFSRNGVPYVVGLHYLGTELQFRVFCSNIFFIGNTIVSKLSIFDDLTLEKLHFHKVDHFDTVLFDDDTQYELREPVIFPPDMLVHLANQFPEVTKEEVEFFVEILQQTATHGNMSVRVALEKYFPNTIKMQVILSHFAIIQGLFDIPLSVYLMVLIWSNHGYFYPVGGPQAIFQSMLARYEANGGKYIQHCEVVRFLTRKNSKTEKYEIYGVRICNGSEYHSHAVVSDIGASVTYSEDMLGTELFVAGDYEKKLAGVTKGEGFSVIWMGFNGTALDFEFENTNYYYYPNHETYWENMDAYRAQKSPNFNEIPIPMYFFTSVASRDPSLFMSGKSDICVLIPTPVKWFEEWKDSKHGARPEDYNAFKSEIASLVKGVIEEKFPLTRGRMLGEPTVGTPLTAKHFLNRENLFIQNFRDENLQWMQNVDKDIVGLFNVGAQVAGMGVETCVKNAKDIAPTVAAFVREKKGS